MRKSERTAKAWEELLKLAQKGSVQIFFRGVNERDQLLYEVRCLAASKIYENLTEEQVIKALTGEGK